MNWPLLSLRVGTPRPFGPKGQPSAIDKQAVAESAYLDFTGFTDDRQGDPSHHGGPEKAVHHYASEHYAVWRRELARYDGLQNMDIGGFGENVSTIGLTEANVAVGDIFTLGHAVIQLTQPRQPCWKLSQRFNVKGMALKVQTSGRTGWYYRVLEPGLIRPGDRFQRQERPRPAWTLDRVLNLLYRDSLDLADLRQLAVLPETTDRMRALAAKRLRDLTVEDWAPRLEGR